MTIASRASQHMVTFKQAYDAAIEQCPVVWESLTPVQMTEAIYRAMRRLDAEAAAAARAACYPDARWAEPLAPSPLDEFSTDMHHSP
jgi:hypothetical protein